MANARGISWGIIGAGDVCEVKSGPGFYKSEGSRLVAITKRTEEGARDFAARHGVERWYTDPEALIADREVEAIYIATPPHLHAELAVKALAAGKPVLLEKPMARTAEECDAVVEAGRKAGLPVWVAYYRRYLRKFVTIKELLENGEIGEPRSLLVDFSKALLRPTGSPPWRLVPEISGGGLFADLGSHMLDILDWLLGPIAVVRGGSRNAAGAYPAEDQVHAAVEFASGLPGTLLWDFAASFERDRTTIRGSSGYLEISCFDEEPIRLVTEKGERRIEAPFPPHVHQALIEAINEELRGGEPCRSTGLSAARTARIMDALLASHRPRRSLLS